MPSVVALLIGLLVAATLAGVVFLAVAALLVRRFAAEAAPVPARRPGVTVLKPLCGDEPNLYENLRSFCTQDYPEVQVVFGVGRADDPAAAVVERLRAELPAADIALVIGERIHGPNLKISNVINMMAAARHDLLVLCDSDMRARPEYLEAVVGTLLEPGVGLVTCLYTGRPVPGGWSRLGAMFINHGFLPQVLVGRRVGAGEGCFGATLALSRQTLARLGGFEALVDKLADDYALGVAVRDLGLAVALSPHIIETQVVEPDFITLWHHELRWGRTLRSIEPLGYGASVITQPLLPAVLLLLLSGGAPFAVAIFGAVVAVRVGYSVVLDAALKVQSSPPWLIPLRDFLSVAVLLASFCGTGVTWRAQTFRVDSDGQLTRDGDLRR
ncbi:MAG: bacteriohopanetetrol glucosamine biosynthesis glycosyltransferase HpnI [Rhodospirillaceae bacterium]